MATAKWSTPGAESSELSGTALNSLASGSSSTAIAYDNSTNLDLYGRLRIALGSITPTVGAYISIAVYAATGSVTPDFAGAGAGDVYVVPLTTTASAKVIIVPMIRLYPFPVKIVVTNNSGTAFAASGNGVYLTPYDEAIS